MPLLQQILFEKALGEKNIEFDNLHIDLEHAKCYNGNKVYNVLYPIEYLNKINAMNHDKIYDYNFRGLRIPIRDWVAEYENLPEMNNVIEFTNKGRIIEEKDKFKFDNEYYQLLCNSKFTLCPAGDFLWSYRFFEAALCKSIPVIHSEDQVDITMEGFRFYYKNDKHVYRDDWVEHNYNLFIKMHML